MVTVSIDRVCKVYESAELVGPERRLALSDLSLEVRDGETVSLVGPSGCGKSTLLRIVAGLDQPTSGRILYDGRDVTDRRPQDRELGMVFQDYALYPPMKGKGNLQYYFDTHGRDEDEATRRIRETARVMGVDFELLLGQLPDTLSGGQKQRVAIARCIVRDPTLFLMDEPICNLDAKLREQTRLEMKALLRKFGITTLYVTHDQQEALFMGDQIAVLNDGRLEQVGGFDDLYYQPVNLFVATFIGTPPLTVLEATVADGGLHVDGARWSLPPDIEVPAGPVLLGVRPESWHVGAEDGMPCDVRRIERLPSQRAAYLHGRTSRGDLAAVVPVDHPDVDHVRVAPDPEQIYLFSPDDGRALRTPGVPELF